MSRAQSSSEGATTGNAVESIGISTSVGPRRGKGHRHCLPPVRGLFRPSSCAIPADGVGSHIIALQEAHLDADPMKQLQSYKNYGVNHVALVVSNVKEIEEKLINGGYKKGIETPLEKYRKRIYYFDDAGLEWELVEYDSDKPDEKYLYE